MYSEEFNIGADNTATITKTVTKIAFMVRIFLFIYSAISCFTLIKLMTKRAWAIISNIINPKSTNLLKNLYNSISTLKPKKIECAIKNNADPIPKNKKYLFLLVSLLIFLKSFVIWYPILD